MTRGGPENRSRLLRAGAAVLVASALLIAKDKNVVMAGTCPEAAQTIKDTNSYTIRKDCPGTQPDLYTVDSKTRSWIFWRSSAGIVYAYDRMLKADCVVKSIAVPEGIDHIGDAVEGVQFGVSNSETCDENLKV